MTSHLNHVAVGQKWRIEEIAAWSIMRGVQINMDYGGVHVLIQSWPEIPPRFIFLAQHCADPDGVMTVEWEQIHDDAVQATKHYFNGVYWTNFNSWLEDVVPGVDHAKVFEKM